VVAAGGQNGTVKVWEVDLGARRLPADLEPAGTFRGHLCGCAAAAGPSPRPALQIGGTRLRSQLQQQRRDDQQGCRIS
jgi:hypothetical protein